MFVKQNKYIKLDMSTPLLKSISLQEWKMLSFDWVSYSILEMGFDRLLLLEKGFIALDKKNEKHS